MAGARREPSLNAIVMTLFNRPAYARQTLQALSKCVGIKEHALILCVEPVNAEVIAIARAVDFTKVSVVINSERYGPHKNAYEAMKLGFTMSDYVILVQEDDELSPDALRYFEYGRSRYLDDKDTFSVSAYSLMKEKDRPGEDMYFSAGRRRLLVPYTFATWRDRWDEPGGMASCWDMTGSITGGWDVHIETHIRRGRCQVYPAVPRVQNIGALGGRYTPSAEWHMANVHNDFWAGDPRVRDLFRERADSWLTLPKM